MLCELHITNLALIEQLSLVFADGLSVLTGETGAGKSIILQAIHLLSGGKGASTWVRSGTDSTTIEALFEVGEDHQILEKLREQGFDADGTIVIKRVLSQNGRSRFYINGSPATAKITGELTENLFSVASQHDHQQLLAARYHLDFIDAVGGLWQQRADFSRQYDAWQQKKNEYDDLLRKEMEKEQRKDFLSFQVREIMDARLIPEEDGRLVMEKQRLKSADDLNRLGRKSYSLLYDVIDPLAQMRKNLVQMTELDASVASLSEEVAGLTFQLEEKLTGLRDYLDTITDNPQALETVMARLDILQQLKRKYGPELADVISYGSNAANELEELEALDIRLEKLEKELKKMEDELQAAAGKLSRERRKTAQELAVTIRNELLSLCLDRSLFEIKFSEGEPMLSSLGRTGADRPAFMFSANPGEPVKPIAQIASGGELSRLLLALKCLLARKDQVETVIFDEVDTGISGKAAESVARKIKELASHHQVICITHLAQIASCAHDHYRVSKYVSNDRTHTDIVLLDETQKVMELAGMLDGDSVTQQTLAYVTELINRNQ
ncbi:MAG: DNA repair protein RecN [Proteobacteria bacterium]|nr:DNA repair protein RecN [Pseudomonadota bacterium]MBU4298294.1 DNA repair protein RecN [Pseudomonadota bacterium]MCG2747563.1 DNA repair protein RecN [Desulfobulbaceae bacterium]